MEKKGTDVKELKLLPSSGGRFEITVNGGLIWSKLETKAFPETKHILDQLG